MTRSKRLFFALWPEPAQQATLAEAARNVVERSGGHAVPAENLHITLVFLGSVPEPDIDSVERIAEKVAGEVGQAPVSVALDVFEHWQKPRIICLTTQQPASAATSRIAELLLERLTAAGFSPDIRPFRPHVTVARKVSRGGTTSMLPPLRWAFDEFALVESQTGPAGAVYRCRRRFTVAPPTLY